MTLSLTKGANLSLTKTEPGLTKVRLGLGWSPRSTAGAAFDLDASAILVTTAGKVRSDADFIFYGQLASAEGSVVHQGDNLTGDGDGDDEQILVDLTKVPADIDRIIFVVSIYDYAARSQHFGDVSDSFIRVVNEDNNNEIVRYDLREDASTETALNFAELYRNGAEWKFRAIGQGYADGLGGVARDFGVNI